MDQKPAGNVMKSARLLWIVFSVTPLFFLFVAFLTSDKAARKDFSTDFRLYLVIFAFIILMTTLALRKTVYADQTPQQRFQRYFFCWLTSEMIALVGTAGAIINGDLQFFLPFFLVSILLTLTLPPRLE